MRKKLLLLTIVTLAFTLRIWNINWDGGLHLQPDERFLTMVANAMRIASSFSQYLDPLISPMNPYNIGYKFFVYGTFPLTITKLGAVLFRFDTYDLFNQFGRVLSAFVDTLCVLFIFGIVSRLRHYAKLSPWVPYLSAFLYAIAVYPIQISHFFAMDTFLTVFTIGAFYFLLIYYDEKGKYQVSLIMSAISFGLAIGSKVNAIAITPLLAVLFFLLLWRKNVSFFGLGVRVFVFLIISYIVLRIADPRFFASARWLDLSINPNFIDNIRELEIWVKPEAWYPPGVQWHQTMPVIFLLRNVMLFGLGVPYFLCICIGIKKILSIKQLLFWAIISWVLAFFFYQSIQVVKTLRYIVFLYPFFAFFAAVGFIEIINWSDLYFRKLVKQFHSHRKLSKTLVSIIGLCLVSAWTIAFMHIYLQTNTRVEASRWIYEHVPANATIIHEAWDDGLPQGIQGVQILPYQYIEAPIFDPDTPQKMIKIQQMLDRADYYILSSNRGWGSVVKIPDRYPMQIAFYQDLFAGKKNYTKVAEFTSYPMLCVPLTQFCLSFNDDSAEELFTVYDHPKVIIFQHIKS